MEEPQGQRSPTMEEPQGQRSPTMEEPQGQRSPTEALFTLLDNQIDQVMMSVGVIAGQRSPTLIGDDEKEQLERLINELKATTTGLRARGSSG